MLLFEREDTRYLQVQTDLPTGTEIGDLDDPEFAFTQDAERPTEWLTGSWTTDLGLTYAQINIGTGATDLAVGQWTYWTRFPGEPESPVTKSGYLRVL